VIRAGSQVLEESKRHACPQEGQERGSVELQAHQPHLSPQGGDGATDPRNHFQTQEIKKI